MYLSYRTIPTSTSSCGIVKIVIERGDANLATLQAMSNRPDLMLDNPAKVFAMRMKSGCYEGYSDEEIAAEAEAANILADAWHNKPEANIFRITAEVMLMLIHAKTESENILSD